MEEGRTAPASMHGADCEYNDGVYICPEDFINGWRLFPYVLAVRAQQLAFEGSATETGGGVRHCVITLLQSLDVKRSSVGTDKIPSPPGAAMR